MNDYPIYNLDPNIIRDYFQALPKLPKKLFVRGTFPTDKHLVFLTVIVSGLALGIDTVAHETAIDVGLTTIAFPGSGLDESIIYPRANRKLAEKILQANGCLLSEFENNQKTNDWLFPARNRLLAGISQATLIIEATHKSGSRITTKFTTEYNRDVLAVPGSIFSTNSEAPNELIRMGATPITNPDELLEALGFQVTKQPPLDLFPQSSPEEQQILKLLGSPMRRGDLIRASGLNTTQANILISQMEMKGIIKDMGGELRRG